LLDQLIAAVRDGGEVAELLNKLKSVRVCSSLAPTGPVRRCMGWMFWAGDVCLGAGV
jgi:hypothetical protein